MSTKMYGIFACISLSGLAFSFFGGTSNLLGTIIIGISNGISVSMALKEHCPTSSAVSQTAVAEQI